MCERRPLCLGKVIKANITNSWTIWGNLVDWANEAGAPTQ